MENIRLFSRHGQNEAMASAESPVISRPEAAAPLSRTHICRVARTFPLHLCTCHAQTLHMIAAIDLVLASQTARLAVWDHSECATSVWWAMHRLGSLPSPLFGTRTGLLRCAALSVATATPEHAFLPHECAWECRANGEGALPAPLSCSCSSHYKLRFPSTSCKKAGMSCAHPRYAWRPIGWRPHARKRRLC